MQRKNFRLFALMLIVASLFFVTACSCKGCSKDPSLNYNNAQGTILEAQQTSLKEAVSKALTDNGATEDEIKQAKDTITNEFNGDNVSDVLDKALTSDKITDKESTKTTVYNEVLGAVKASAISLLGKFYDSSRLDRHQIILCGNEEQKVGLLIEEANEMSTSVNTKETVEDTKNIYQLLSNYYLKINTYKTQMSPIRIYSFKEDGFFSALFNNVLVYPVGWLMQFISNLFGGYYILGLLVITILIRFAMTPVYNSSNNMSLKMQLMQPDLQKLEAKYANKKDPESQQAKQMEQMRIYKKYKMGFGGCFAMLLQFPVFLCVYQAVSRMHLTNGEILNSPNWADKLKTSFLGVDLFLPRGEMWSKQFIGIIIILVLVVGSQVLQQILSQRVQKATYAKSQQDIPAYRRQAMQQNQMGGSMKFMMYFMIVMMGVFVFQSAAGLGIYWLIGNIYSLVQMFINYKFSDRKLARLKKKLGIEE